MKQTFKLSWVLIALLALTVVTSCKKDDDDDDGVQEVTAGFEYEIDAEDALTVHFTNLSENETSVSWDFGDGETSTDENPTHTYDAEGAYTVKLTATNAGGSDVVQQTVNVVDANAQITALTGGSEKTWKLIRDVSTEDYPLEVGPAAHDAIWWAFGLQEDLANRVCMLNDEWTFKADGSMVFDDKGDYWAEGSVYPDDVDDMCAESTTMVNADGVDVSAWSSGTHEWEIAEGKLRLIGTGAYLGLSKAATGAEVMVPQEEVTYDIIKLTDGPTDTLIVEAPYTTGGDQPQPAYWRFVLVHYDNPADEPPIPGPSPNATFSMTVDGLTITLDNTSTNADSYLWDFGDGSTSTEEDPTHTYATGGIYSVKLTATNANGTGEATQVAFVSDVTITDALLQGDPWKVRLAANSVFVGPTLGSPDWWQVPLADMQEGGAWACMMNDEFIFSAGGVYEYRTNGDARNDGYMGQPTGCIDDAALLASGNGAAFQSATHSYVLNTDGERPYIVLTNGSANTAAFIGFYKGYYGGENTDPAVAPNGGNPTNRYEVMGYATNGDKEWLFLSVDLNGAEPDGAAWSVILER